MIRKVPLSVHCFAEANHGKCLTVCSMLLFLWLAHYYLICILSKLTQMGQKLFIFHGRLVPHSVICLCKPLQAKKGKFDP